MKADLSKFKEGYKKVFESREAMKKTLSGIDTDLDGIEAYARVLEMDGLKDDKNVKGIFAQINAIREKLETL